MVSSKNFAPSNIRGFSFVELLVTAAIMSLVFGGLFKGVQLMVSLIGDSKAQASALVLMTDRMEYFRSLPYNDLGTDGGVPSGAIAQTSTTTLNNIVYNERVLIQYVDDPADGIGGLDSNGILADYKQIKVVYTWALKGEVKTASLVSNIVPNGIETTAGGGTIRVNVFDAAVQPQLGAEVRFVNTTTSTTIDTVRYTDISGVTHLSGAPAAANYEITVTHAGYSTDGTYVATTSNPSPTTLPVAVLESQVSTMNFQIDELSDLKITTVGAATYDNFTDSFSDASLLVTASSTTVDAGALILDDTAGVYKTEGVAQSATTSPPILKSWYELFISASTSADTSAKVSLLYEDGGVLQLVPDSALPGNSVGLTGSSVDISDLDATTYHTLALQATLGTTDTGYTPYIYQWSLSYITTQPPLSGVQLSLEGAKSIGVDAGLQPVLKYTASGVTDGAGQWEQNGIEYDVYTVTVDSAGYTIYEMCPTSPYILSPGVSQEMQLTLGAAAAYSLRVNVIEAGGIAIPNATAHLENTGVDEVQQTSLCGQTYFASGLYDDDDYLLTVSASGYTTEAIAGTTITSGSSTITVILN